MPTLISKATGNFTAATTWALVDATSKLDSEAGYTTLTTAYVYSSAFTPGAITVDGIAVKLAARVASPTGTISVCLYDSTTLTIVKEVTINVSDLPTCSTTNNEGGWIFFKFDAPVTLSATDSYQVGAKCSVASEATLYRDATAGNWSRMLRTTTEQAPAAGDQLDIMGEHTGAGTGNDITVTMDNILTTDFGPGTDGGTAMVICKRGTLNYAYAAATNYYLKLSGNLIVYNGGTLTIGTTTNPIPRDSTAVLEFDPVADGGMGLIVRNGGTFTAQGLSRTALKNIVSCKLNTDEAVGSTVLGVDTDTGWLANDEIGIASTTRTASECEKRTLSVNASATELTITSGLTYAHSGTTPTQAEVILLTRNVKIRAATSSIVSYCNFKETATIDIDWVEFYYLGENVAGKKGIEIGTTTGSCNIQYSSVHDTEDWAIYHSGSGSGANTTISNNVLYNVCTAYNSSGAISHTSMANLIITNNIVMYCPLASSYGFYSNSNSGSFEGNTAVGVNGQGTYLISFQKSIAGLTSHSNASYGLVLYIGATNAAMITWSDFKIWRNSAAGIYFSTSSNYPMANYTFLNGNFFGNANDNILLQAASGIMVIENLIFDNCNISADSTFATTDGLHLGGAGNYNSFNITFKTCTFGVVSGIYRAHTNDINIASTSTYVRFLLENTALASANEIITLPTNLLIGSFIKSTKHDQTAGLHKSWFKYGIIQTDITYYKTASPSQRLTPNNASYKLESGSKKAALNSGATATFSVWVRKSSVAAGGADYNGNQPRLVLKRNDAAGITADTVLDTMTVGLDTWEQLTGTTPAVTDDAVLEVVIDVDGTAGFVNVDDWSVT